ncbi:MAG: NUDIX domain-containing protein [Planctomycetes bacterium]|nr:NUDIX domain-containing protein [Planctomycetota bacterium]
MVRRAEGGTFPGYWTPVTGAVKPGEAIPDAVAREVHEEVGLVVLPLRKVWECRTQDAAYLLHWWLVERVGGEIRPDPREVAECRWVLPPGLASLRTFASDLEFFGEVLPRLLRSTGGGADGRPA